MLLPTKLQAVLGCLFIVSNVVSAHQIDEGSPAVFTINFQAVIDSNTGYFITPSDEDTMLNKFQSSIPENVNRVYSKKNSPIQGGGIIVNMGTNSFAQMRAISNKKRLTQIQCSDPQ